MMSWQKNFTSIILTDNESFLVLLSRTFLKKSYNFKYSYFCVVSPIYTTDESLLVNLF